MLKLIPGGPIGIKYFRPLFISKLLIVLDVVKFVVRLKPSCNRSQQLISSEHAVCAQ